MTDRDMELLDDLVCEFSDPPTEGWFNLGPETQAALVAMWNLCEELKPDYAPCNCGFRDVVCAECGVKR